MFSTSSAVSPKWSWESQTGTSWPIDAPMWKIGLIFLPVTPNGMTLSLWLCTTDITSGRAS